MSSPRTDAPVLRPTRTPIARRSGARGLGKVVMVAGIVLATASVTTGYEVKPVTDGGTIEGKVVFNGPKPPARKIIPTKDKEACGGPREAEQIVLSPDKVVGDVVVFLKKIDQGKAWEKASSSPVLTNSQCDFSPHVQVVQVGSEMEFANNDQVFHNLHAFLDKATVHNMSLPKGGRKIKRPLSEPGLVRVECDAHPWMLAWVYVADSPYYAITGKDGRFAIKDVPPGSYTLMAWQEYTGFNEIPVTVKGGAVAPVTVTLQKNDASK